MINNSRRIVNHAVAYASLLLLLLLLLSPAGAQSGPNGPGFDPQNPYKNFSPSMAIIIVILIAALFLMGFFSIYIRRCSDSTPGAASVRALGASIRRRGAASRGLDAAVIETFPTFNYSAVKGLKIGKGALECAVCLNEFEDDETLRLIPKCDHVFHPECIDAWLESHVTCPVCRANLVPQPGETLQIPDLDPETNDQPETGNAQNDDVSIRVVEEENQGETPAQTETLPPQVMDRNKSVNRNRPPRSRSVRPRMFPKFPRSHSTGHSLVQPGENTDRFTLRLPEDVRKRMVTRALNRTTSCVVPLPREGSSRRGYRSGVGEASSGSSHREVRSFSFRRLDRVLKSDRWNFSMAPPFISRSASVRSPKVMSDNGEGSVSSSTHKGTQMAVKLPSFKCLEPKSDETSLISADSARLPV
ncbi:E3 ubiquitin-protein like [Actinidia chinensis var. chinensis]|uniref:RING-type E3 ubiquitin transferase n=1 Tax=Actinidia chinensis var. chinensis TaxID=1590841 RepID=A0A2R6RBH8_ACTCC|nr:E3 ubiquitin-protein like [Actinidia chinensis var. chinensis]